MGWVVNATPWPLYPPERSGIHCIGGWVGPRAGLDGWGKYRPHRVSIPGSPVPALVTCEVTVLRSRYKCSALTQTQSRAHGRIFDSHQQMAAYK
jgi:hypothetical protein